MGSSPLCWLRVVAGRFGLKSRLRFVDVVVVVAS